MLVQVLVLIYIYQFNLENSFRNSKHSYWCLPGVHGSTLYGYKEITHVNDIKWSRRGCADLIEVWIWQRTKSSHTSQFNGVEEQQQGFPGIHRKLHIRILKCRQVDNNFFISMETQLCHRTFLIHFSITSKSTPLSVLFLLGGTYVSLQCCAKVMNEKVLLLGCSCRIFFSSCILLIRMFFFY